MQQYKSLDLFKFISALLVVVIHTQLLAETSAGYYVRSFCRIAVPFFFVCSSFLFWTKKGAIKKYSLRILSLYLIWSIIYLPYILKTFFSNDIGLLHSLLLYLHGLVIHNTFHASWFLMASVISMNLVYWLSHHLSNRVLLIIGVILYSFSCLSSSYYGIVGWVGFDVVYNLIDRLLVPSNSFFVSFIYVVIGKIIAENGSIPRAKSFPASVCLFFLFGVEIFLVKDIYRLTDAFILLPFFIYFFFNFLICLNVIKVNDDLCILFRRASIIVYLVHYLFIDYYVKNGTPLGSALFLKVIISAIAVSIIIVVGSRYIKPLKWLY